MNDYAQSIADEASAEAIHRAKNAQAAIEVARVAQLDAQLDLKLSEFLDSDKLTQTLEDAVVNALGRGASENKFIDVGRIPFICDDIRGIHTFQAQQTATMAAISETLTLVRNIVFSFIALMVIGMIGVVGDVVLTVLKTH